MGIRFLQFVKATIWGCGKRLKGVVRSHRNPDELAKNHEILETSLFLEPFVVQHCEW